MAGTTLTQSEVVAAVQGVADELIRLAAAAERDSARFTVSAAEPDSDVSPQLAVILAVRAEERRNAADSIRRALR